MTAMPSAPRFRRSSWRTTPDTLPQAAVLAAARRTDAVVYAVTVARPARLDWSRLDGGAHLPLGFDDDPSADKSLAEVCSLTGGRVFVADTTRDLASRFRAIVEEFKNRYLLTYTPSGVPASGWHPLQVRVKRGGVKVNARRGYER